MVYDFRREEDFFRELMAIACFRLFTVPPWPDLPRLRVPFLRRCMALFTDLLAPLL